MATFGLVLTGGGARAAYQVGVLDALADIAGPGPCPFTVISGISAGAINGTAIATGVDDFRAATAKLVDLWMSLQPESVYRTDAASLGGIALRWLKDLGSGGTLGPSRINHLLDTKPLRTLLEKELHVARIPEQIAAGLLRGVAVSATDYHSGMNISFFDGDASIPVWTRHDRVGQRRPIRVDHVLASSAIPVFFPPVEVDGHFYGDGGIRTAAPLSPVIHMGADHVLSIGIRNLRPPDDPAHPPARPPTGVSASEIAGLLLNSVFLDGLDDDTDRLERINRTLNILTVLERGQLKDPLHVVPSLAIRPSTDLGHLAADQATKFPLAVRYMLGGLGAMRGSGWELLSYLAFQPGYVSKLIELGRSDTQARRAEVEAFLSR